MLLQGKLEVMDLATLVQLGGDKEMKIELASNGAAGEVYLGDGKVLHAEAGELKGEKAFFYMLSWEEGSFTVKDARAPQVTVGEEIAMLLLKGAQVLDEGGEGEEPEDIPDEMFQDHTFSLVGEQGQVSLAREEPLGQYNGDAGWTHWSGTGSDGELVEVPIGLLSPENTTEADLYLPMNGEMVLYKKAGASLHKGRIEKLVRQGVKLIYLQRKEVGSFLRRTGDDIRKMLLSHRPSIQELKKVHEKLTQFSSSLLAVPSRETIELSVRMAALLPECIERNEDISTQVLFLLEKDIATSVHATNVHFLVSGFSYFLGLRGDDLARMSAMGMLHDVGKAMVPDFILKKPGKLSPGEFEEVKRHTIYGRDILMNNGADQFVAGALCHHENVDGSGYPMGLKHGDIPPEALVIKVCDIYEALTGYRPYRSSFKPYAAARLMIEEFVKVKKGLPMGIVEKFISFVGAARL